MKKHILPLVIVALIAACTPPTDTAPPDAAPPDAPAPGQPTPTSTPTEPPRIEEAPLPLLPSERDHHPYNWLPEDVKGLDPWGDSTSDATDIVAVYQREMDGNFEFRLDILNFEDDELAPIYFAVDFLEGGSTQVNPENSLAFEIEWDLLVSVIGGEFKLYDPSFTHISDQLVTTEINRQLDFVFFAISESAFAGWDGDAFQMQALLLSPANAAVLDQTTPVATNSTTGRAKLVLPFGNVFVNSEPWTATDIYDGFYQITAPGRANERAGERRGGRYMLDAAERYEIPLTIDDVMIQEFPGAEYLRIHERFRTLAGKDLLDLNMSLGYGHFMPWQPDDVDAKAIEIAIELRERLDLPVSDVFYPYEGLLTPGDIQVIKDAGFEAIYAHDQTRFSFFGWIDDLWSDQEAHRDEIETIRKIHQFNGVKFFFHSWINNYGGFVMDERWGPSDWNAEFDEYEQYNGTDKGLFYWWRRVLHDMAMDPDQEQFYTIGTDMLTTPWRFQKVIEWNFQWLASHPWIEMTTFSSITNRGWQVIDHGYFDLAADELLMRFPNPEEWGFYNASFPQHYYGGISDGHNPVIPAGVVIEAYYDYIPYLRDGELIPSERIMGDDQTPGSIVYETLANLRNAPENPITTIAWLSYYIQIAEQTFHEGAALREIAKSTANFMGQVNKIVAAAHWAAEAEAGALASETQVYEKDLDLDGELEYVMQNDQVFAIFENDGGRLEYAFAYDSEYGPLQLIAPANQYFLKPGPDNGVDFQNGEAALALARNWDPDGAFVEDVNLDGHFDYEPLIASIEGQSLTFSYETRPVTKTFTLEGVTIHVHYELGSIDKINLGFANAVNQLGVFSKDWIWNFESLQMEEILGWQMTTGGSVFLNMENTFSVQTASFYDSPAREEMQTRENVSTYPKGHGMCFPCSWIKVWEPQEVDFSLSLSAAPIDKDAYTPLPTPIPTPTAAPPTPTLDPGMMDESYLIYDDSLAPGWWARPWDSEVKVASTAMVYDGSQAIEVAAQQYGGVSLGIDTPPDLSPYNWLVFYINIGETKNPLFVLDMYYEDVPISTELLYIADYVEGGQLEPGQWYQVVVPLGDLIPEGGTFYQINFAYDGSGVIFYIDEIRFVAAGP